MTPTLRLTLPGSLRRLLLTPCALAPPERRTTERHDLPRKTSTVVRSSRPYGTETSRTALEQGLPLDNRLRHHHRQHIFADAHVVGYPSRSQCRSTQAATGWPATSPRSRRHRSVILKLDNIFLRRRPPLPRASVLPQIRIPVLAYGYPTSGTSLSSPAASSRASSHALCVPDLGYTSRSTQPSTADSGGPAIAYDEMVGLVFGHLANSRHRLRRSEQGPTTPYGLAAQLRRQPGSRRPADAEDPALRRLLKLDDSVRGIIVRVRTTAPLLRPRTIDIITTSAITDQRRGHPSRIHDDLRVASTISSSRTTITAPCRSPWCAPNRAVRSRCPCRRTGRC